MACSTLAPSGGEWKDGHSYSGVRTSCWLDDCVSLRQYRDLLRRTSFKVAVGLVVQVECKINFRIDRSFGKSWVVFTEVPRKTCEPIPIETSWLSMPMITSCSMKVCYHYTWNREIVFNSQKLVKRRRWEQANIEETPAQTSVLGTAITVYTAFIFYIYL